MTYTELTRKLRRLGCAFRRQVKGSHEIWWRPDRQLYTVIPNHGNEDIAKGTFHKVLKDLDFTEDDLEGV